MNAPMILQCCAALACAKRLADAVLSQNQAKSALTLNDINGTQKNMQAKSKRSVSSLTDIYYLMLCRLL